MFTLTTLNETELRLKQKNKKTSFVFTSNDKIVHVITLSKGKFFIMSTEFDKNISD